MTRQEAIDALLETIEIEATFVSSSEPLFAGLAEAHGTSIDRVRFLFEQELESADFESAVSPEIFKDFSDDELLRLAEFHTSELGMKAMDLMPAIADSLVESSVPVVEGVIDKVLERLDGQPALTVVK